MTKIREQCQKQEETIREQETELDSKRGELQKLKDEESSLEKEYEENKRKLDKLSKSLQDTQLQICQVNFIFRIQFICGMLFIVCVSWFTTTSFRSRHWSHNWKRVNDKWMMHSLFVKRQLKRMIQVRRLTSL